MQPFCARVRSIRSNLFNCGVRRHLRFDLNDQAGDRSVHGIPHRQQHNAGDQRDDENDQESVVSAVSGRGRGGECAQCREGNPQEEQGEIEEQRNR
jgi:hypothetical protein